MSPAVRSLVSLLVILAASGAIALAVRLRPAPPPPPRDQIVPVFDFSPTAVRAIRLATRQGRLAAEHRDGHWQVQRLELPAEATSESSEKPDQAVVDEALASLVGEIARLPEVGRFPLVDQPMSAYGLAAPVAEITLDLDAGAQAKLEIGDRTATGTGYYARTPPSDDVLQIGSLIFNEIAAALYRLRGFAERGQSM